MSFLIPIEAIIKKWGCRLLQKIKKYPQQSFLLLLVCFLHFLLLFYFFQSPSQMPSPFPSEKKTIQISTTIKPSVTQVPQKAPEKKAAPVQKKVASAPHPQKAKPENPQKPSNHSLREMKNALSRLESSALPPSKKELVAPKAISTNLDYKGCDKEEEYSEMSGTKAYHKILLEYLQKTLTLPENGEVELKVILKPDGHVAELQILRSTSYKNECFLAKELPKLRFPQKTKEHSKKIPETFILVFRSKNL